MAIGAFGLTRPQEVPAVLGGKIPFVEDIQLNDFYEGEDIVIDGRAAKESPLCGCYLMTQRLSQLLVYQQGQTIMVGLQTRFVLSSKHPEGLNPSVAVDDIANFQIILDTFILW